MDRIKDRSGSVNCDPSPTSEFTVPSAFQFTFHGKSISDAALYVCEMTSRYTDAVVEVVKQFQ